VELLRDSHAKLKFHLLTVLEGALETEQGSIFNPGRDGNGKNQGSPARVKPNIPLRTLRDLIGCQGKIVNMEIGSIGNKTGRPCPGLPVDPPFTSKAPPESSPSASKLREKILLEGIAPGIERVRAERKTTGVRIAATIVLIPLVPMAQNVVGLVDFLEPVLGLGIVPVCVRMILKGQSSKGHPDYAFTRVSRDPKNSVVVFFLHWLATTFGGVECNCVAP